MGADRDGLLSRVSEGQKKKKKKKKGQGLLFVYLCVYLFVSCACVRARLEFVGIHDGGEAPGGSTAGDTTDVAEVVLEGVEDV